MLDFLGIGPGERIADLGAGTGYSILQMADKVGATGVVYTRHDPRILVAAAAPGAAAEREGALPENVVVMETPDTAPFNGEAKHLDLVTMLFSYHDLVARGRNRRAFNRAVFDALSPDRFYVIAEHAAPSGAGVGAAHEGRVEERLVRADVEAAGFVFVEAAQLLPSTAGQRSSPQAATSSQYLLKFRRPR
jgi:predicted methyltransferase